MTRRGRSRVLAVGVDAAEATLVRRLLETGALPCLRRLLDGGVWGAVRSPAAIGSGAVWPTFVSATPPAVHGLHGEWAWRPDLMRVARPAWDHLVPFWRRLAAAGHTAVVLDVPLAPLAARPGCVEVAEWGAHDQLTGRLAVWPARLEPLVREEGGVHPFAAERVDAEGPHDAAGLARVVARCRRGVEQRGALALRLLREVEPDLALVVFTEVHRASHLLWHTVDPTHPTRAAAGPGPAAGDEGLPGVFREVDRQLGRLVEAARPDATVLVFALHGMRPAHGVPAVLDPLLRALGFAARRGWREQSWAERAGGALAAVKRAAPPGLKVLYRRLAPDAVVGRLTQLAMPVPAYDWARTRAFALPTDQHGWVRVNLAGREARGIVEPGRYDATCAAVAAALLGVTDESGAPLVRDVVRTADGPEAAAGLRLPDLVVHWSDATLASPLRVRTPSVAAPAVGSKHSGQHAPAGFFVWRPGDGRTAPPPDGVGAEALAGLIAAWLGAGGP